MTPFCSDLGNGPQLFLSLAFLSSDIIMRDKIFFISDDKSFQVTDISENDIRWLSITERSRRFSCKITIDEDNLKWVCENLKQASRGTGDHYRRWGRLQHPRLYRVYQNYNIHGRFVRIETWLGNRKSAMIIPEAGYNKGWVDIAEKILRFLGPARNPRIIQPPTPQLKSYFDAAKIQSWPEKMALNGKSEQCRLQPASP